MENNEYLEIIFNDLDDDECYIVSSLYDEAEHMFYGAQYLEDGTLDYMEFYYDEKIIRVKTIDEFIRCLKLKTFL
jgi:hypothetical protein